jgi:hypothetical protein
MRALPWPVEIRAGLDRPFARNSSAALVRLKQFKVGTHPSSTWRTAQFEPEAMDLLLVAVVAA